jgi:deazaflavin-dependent oxidoreductase (nitroreductase family)
MPLTGTYAPSTDDWARDQAETYEATGGTEKADLRGMPIVVLTSVGAKSGNLRKNALMRVEYRGSYAVIASKGGAEKHPSWYHNLVANPHVELQDGDITGDYAAHESTGEEREAWWAHAVAAYPDYESYAVGLARTIPVFVLTPMPPA